MKQTANVNPNTAPSRIVPDLDVDSQPMTIELIPHGSRLSAEPTKT